MHPEVGNKRGVFTRALAVMLLGFIICGTTVEAAHTHGNLNGAQSSVGGPAFLDPASAIEPLGNLLNCNDCLICQLQHHFSATLISVPPSLAPSAFKVRFFNFTSPAFYSQTKTPHISRGPPQTSL